MAPVIRSRYEQYKRDTQQFTTWLAQTAISLGYPLSKFDQEVEEIGKDGVNVEVDIKTAKSKKKNAKRNARARDKVKLARGGLAEKQGNESSGGPSGKYINQSSNPGLKADQQMIPRIRGV